MLRNRCPQCNEPGAVLLRQEVATGLWTNICKNCGWETMACKYIWQADREWNAGRKGRDMKYLSRDEKVKAYEMLIDGHTHAEIAREFGVTRQAIYQLFGGIRDSYGLGIRMSTRERIIYPAITEYLLKNELSLDKFARSVNSSPEVLKKCLTGDQDMRKRVIDAILKETGMSYEEAFAERDNEEDDVQEQDGI